VVLGVTFALIVLQPDFGTATLIGMLGMIMLVVSGVRMRHVALLGVLAVPLLVVVLAAKPYRVRRIIAFLRPGADIQGIGYHAFQSKVTLGSGGWTGVGPGRGLQKLGFLPEAETDFIFAVFGQEHGLVGCLLLMAVYVALFHAGMHIARSAPDVLGALLALGVTLLIGLQMFINVGVAAAAMPTKGISLPFVSYGGSSMLALSAGIGVMLNVARHSPPGGHPRVRGATRRRRER
jgi:cell division protein FtsW